MAIQNVFSSSVLVISSCDCDEIKHKIKLIKMIINTLHKDERTHARTHIIICIDAEPQKWTCKVYAQEEAARELASFHISTFLKHPKRV